eukprot:3928364-Ditylum_brightwellii.AAC.1
MALTESGNASATSGDAMKKSTDVPRKCTIRACIPTRRHMSPQSQSPRKIPFPSHHLSIIPMTIQAPQETLHSLEEN